LLFVNLLGCVAVSTERATRYFDYDDEIFGSEPQDGLVIAVRDAPSRIFEIDILLKNVSDRNLCINSNFVVDQGGYDASPNLFIIVENLATGNRVPYRSKKNMSIAHRGESPSVNWFSTLSPREFLALHIDLTDYYLLNPHDQYRVYVEYNNLETGYSKGGKWIEKYAWVGQLMSNSALVGSIQ
jgi:hypothetical protein